MRYYTNIMLIDPFYKEMQISLFKSKSYFDLKDDSKLNDVILKTILYTTERKKTKMIQQFSGYYKTFESKEEYEERFDDFDLESESNESLSLDNEDT